MAKIHKSSLYKLQTGTNKFIFYTVIRQITVQIVIQKVKRTVFLAWGSRKKNPKKNVATKLEGEGVRP